MSRERVQQWALYSLLCMVSMQPTYGALSGAGIQVSPFQPEGGDSNIWMAHTA